MPSATVRGPYASINTIFDPPQFLLDTTFKCPFFSNIYFLIIYTSAYIGQYNNCLKPVGIQGHHCTLQYFSKTEHCKTLASDSEVSTRPNSIQFLLSSLFQLLLINIKNPFFANINILIIYTFACIGQCNNCFKPVGVQSHHCTYTVFF